MKQIANYIIEKFKINSKTIGNQNEKELDYEEFKSYIQKLFNINDEDFDHMIKCFGTDIDDEKLPKSKFELIDNEHKSYEQIGNVCADLINHPSKYKKLWSVELLYSSVTSKSIDTDLRVFLYNLDDENPFATEDGKKFLCFLDYDDNKFYIFYLNEENK